jgi:UDP-glucose:glycoprotein glucosyltransferase
MQTTKHTIPGECTITYVTDHILTLLSVPPYPKTFTFDHAYPSLVGSPRPDFVAVLYGDLESASFRPLHSYLLKVAASERRVAYIFRPAPPDHRNKAEGSYLTGYGIGLDLKKMEYLAVDDRQGGASTAKEERERSDETVTSDLIIDLINKHPVNETLDPSMPLTESELLG